jgi:hypothetical protein
VSPIVRLAQSYAAVPGGSRATRTGRTMEEWPTPARGVIEYLVGYNIDYNWKVIGDPDIRPYVFWCSPGIPIPPSTATRSRLFSITLNVAAPATV